MKMQTFLLFAVGFLRLAPPFARQSYSPLTIPLPELYIIDSPIIVTLIDAKKICVGFLFFD